MRTDKALKIAESIWADTVRQGSLFDTMVNEGPKLDSLLKKGKMVEVNNKMQEMSSEIIARWANIIKEVADNENV